MTSRIPHIPERPLNQLFRGFVPANASPSCVHSRLAKPQQGNPFFERPRPPNAQCATQRQPCKRKHRDQKRQLALLHDTISINKSVECAWEAWLGIARGVRHVCGVPTCASSALNAWCVPFALCAREGVVGRPGVWRVSELRVLWWSLVWVVGDV